MTASEYDWYVLRNEKKVGPARFEQLQELANRKVLQKSDLLWRPGLEGWIRAENVPSLFPEGILEADVPIDALEPPPLPKASIKPPPLPDNGSLPLSLPMVPTGLSHVAVLSPSTSLGASVSAPPTPGNLRQNYFARHWRGELPLYVSYWLNGVGGYIIVTVVVTIVAVIPMLKEEFAPAWALLSVALVWLISLAAVNWQVVGAWKSATNHQIQNPRNAWGAVAKVSLAIAVLRVLGTFGYMGVPQIVEHYEIFRGDENLGGHNFRVTREGRDLEFTGGISFGVAREFEQFIDAMGGLQTIRLDSIGGRVYEAQRIANLIRAKGLDTYVTGRCLSACTVIFLGGRNRLVTPEAKLGFHQPDFPGMTARERNRVIAVEERRLKQLGISEEFAKHANATLPEDMWFPSLSELVVEKVVTQVVAPSK
jgi:hypothetical protein